MVAVALGLSFTLNSGTVSANEKVTICHATSSESNPWERLVVDSNATNGHFDENGTPLSGHEDDVLLPGDVPCPTPPATTPAITASGVCVSDHEATITGSTSGFPDGEVVLFAQRADIDYGGNSGTANGAFSFPVNVLSINGPQTGSMNFEIVAQQGDYSASVLVTVDFSKCQPAPVTTQPAPTTAPPTTAPVPTTAPPVVTTMPPHGDVVTTIAPPTKLPTTGSGSGAIALMAAALLGLGTMLLMRTRRTNQLG